MDVLAGVEIRVHTRARASSVAATYRSGGGLAPVMADWSDEREGMTGSLEAPSAGLEVPLLPRPEEFLDHDAFGVAVEGGNDMADLLDDLRALEDLEHGGPAGMDFIDEVDDVYKMKELIEEKPRDVIQYIEEEGTIKLGEFDVQVGAVCW